MSRVYAPAIYPFPDPVLIRQHCLDPTLVKAYAADFCGTATLRLEHEKGWRAPGMTADGCLEIAATALALTLFAGAKVQQPSVPAQAKVVVYRTNLAGAPWRRERATQRTEGIHRRCSSRKNAPSIGEARQRVGILHGSWDPPHLF